MQTDVQILIQSQSLQLTYLEFLQACDKFICEGDSVQIFATGGLTYVWNTDPTLSSTIISNPFASPLQLQLILLKVQISMDVQIPIKWLSMLIHFQMFLQDRHFSMCEWKYSTFTGNRSSQTYTWSPNAVCLQPTFQIQQQRQPEQPLILLQVKTEMVVKIQPGNCYDQCTCQQFLPDQMLPFVLETVHNFNASGGIIYVWNFNTTLSDFVIADPWAQPTNDMTYF
jgi:hypothetical protein